MIASVAEAVRLSEESTRLSVDYEHGLRATCLRTLSEALFHWPADSSENRRSNLDRAISVLRAAFEDEIVRVFLHYR